jgi:hypothetical protein
MMDCGLHDQLPNFARCLDFQEGNRGKCSLLEVKDVERFEIFLLLMEVVITQSLYDKLHVSLNVERT